MRAIRKVKVDRFNLLALHSKDIHGIEKAGHLKRDSK